MLAARLHGNEDLRVEEVANPKSPAPANVVLEIATAGICGSDAAEYRYGPTMAAIEERHPVSGHHGPVTIGHEFAGRVVARGEGAERFAEGALVACGAGISCGVCSSCRAGMTNLCERYSTVGFHWDGGLAGYCTVPEAICVDAGGAGLSADAAALAQPMAIAAHAVRRGETAADDDVLIIGAGGIGAFLTYLAGRVAGAVTVVDISAERLELASCLGAGATVAVSDSEGPLGLERPPSLVFEVSGTASGLAAALAAAGRGTRIVLVGVQRQGPAPDWRRVTHEEQKLIGTVAHVCAVDLPAAVAALASREEGWADIAPTVLPLGSLLEEGIRPLVEGRPQQVKTLIDPWIDAARPSDTTPRPEPQEKGEEKR